MKTIAKLLLYNKFQTKFYKLKSIFNINYLKLNSYLFILKFFILYYYQIKY